MTPDERKRAFTRKHEYFTEMPGATVDVHTAVTGERTELLPPGTAVDVLGIADGYAVVRASGTEFYHWMPARHLTQNTVQEEA
jgi:hypothetical protein